MAAGRRASPAAERVAAALARRRHARLLHPAGRPFAAEVMIWGTPGPPTGVPLLDLPARWPATVRLSKGVPTPVGWPDVLGVAVRLHRDPEPPVDLLVSSSGAAPVLRNLPLPRRRFTGTYTSIMPFRAGARRWFLAALADPDSPDLGRSLAEATAAVAGDEPRLVLAVASTVGPWRPFGQVSLRTPRGAREDAALAFDPVGNVPPGLRLAGPLAWLRETSYRGSRRARGAGAQSGGSAGVTV
ncbi:phosphodiesterase [Micromonospora sp. PPF5-17]|uniref:Phosphodiesterase n=1 Tax=Micromonospora solifontis TaxID=2487138 RepID=A0ABX9WEB1_9ACTN|nr:phosphodiesterase [Micromonospora sp. PPF5-17B]NES37824.1 phosphodiesterase [Micromonospora solifontis]NES58556.1 phosphodiesterase [Micromonospora sp. PPF5-6]RNL97946.1 phosphodiesterase [Micromonospora solifontis]